MALLLSQSISNHHFDDNDDDYSSSPGGDEDDDICIDEHPHFDMDHQRAIVQQERRNRHEKWCQGHQEKGRFDHPSSRIRAAMLVNEAWALEKTHVRHQLEHAKAAMHRVSGGATCNNTDNINNVNANAASTLSLPGHYGSGRTIGPSDKTPSPSRGGALRRAANRNASPTLNSTPRSSSLTANNADAENFSNTQDDCQHNHTPRPSTHCIKSSAHTPSACEHGASCACVRAPMHRQLTPKYRVMSLLQHRFEPETLEDNVDSLEQTYGNAHEMLEDIIYRYGPEAEVQVPPELVLANAEEKMRNVDDKWLQIGRCVNSEMQHRDAFQTVIRNLSVMRIFLEGSQSSQYGCDLTERARRDALHQQVLDDLAASGKLFVHGPSSHNNNFQ